MPRYTFDFDLEAWIRCLKIEADSLEEAKEKLYEMSIEDIIDEGYVNNFSISELDIEEEE